MRFFISKLSIAFVNFLQNTKEIVYLRMEEILMVLL